MARFLGNSGSKEFHDLTRQRSQCQIGEITAAHRRLFVPDTLEQAIADGFEPCFYCLGTFAGLIVGEGDVLASPSDLEGEDLGDRHVVLTWTYPGNIDEQNITFDVYSSADPLDPFRALRVDRHRALSATLVDASDAADLYFTVVARRGGRLSLPSKTIHLRVRSIPAQVSLTAAGLSPGQPAAALGFPFRIDGKGGVFAYGGDPWLRGRILQLLMTSPGERVCLPEYGTRLRDLVFDPNNDILAATTEFMVTRALQKYLADAIHVNEVRVRNQDNALTIDIVYLRKADLRVEQVRVGIPAA